MWMLAILGLGCETDPVEELAECQAIDLTMDADVDAVVSGNNAFAFDLYQELAAEPGNVFWSPLSVSAALGMTLGGAEGNTQTEMEQALALGLPEADWHAPFGRQLDAMHIEDPECGVELSLVNQLWGQQGYPWKADFLALTADVYGAPLVEVDYLSDYEGARVEINDWVADETQERIQDLLPPGVLNSDTRLVLTNAIYFKAAWEDAFDPEQTRDGTWQPSGATVDMMHKSNAEFPVQWGDGYTALQLPYNGENQSMVLILPDEADGLDALEAQLDEAFLADVVDGLQVQSVDEVAIPRFTMEYQASLVPGMKSLGMIDAFSDVDADLSGMADTEEHLFVTAIVHKAFLEVNESGSEAAAATAVVVGTESAGPMFIADHPFFFVIQDELSGSILFMGRLSEPE